MIDFDERRESSRERINTYFNRELKPAYGGYVYFNKIYPADSSALYFSGSVHINKEEARQIMNILEEYINLPREEFEITYTESLNEKIARMGANEARELLFNEIEWRRRDVSICEFAIKRESEELSELVVKSRGCISDGKEMLNQITIRNNWINSYKNDIERRELEIKQLEEKMTRGRA